MSTKAIFFCLIGFACGLAVLIGIQILQARPQQLDQEKPKGTVAVARRHIEIAEGFSADSIRFEKWPEELIPDGAVTSWSEIDGKFSKLTVVKGQVIDASMLAVEYEVRSIHVPDGYRAVSAQVTMHESLIGMLQAGDRMDLTGFFEVNGKTIAKTFLQDIQVFAVNDKIEQVVDADGTALDVKTVCFMVTRRQVQEILVAKRAGRLHACLSCRSWDEHDADDEQAVSLDDILGEDAPPSDETESEHVETPEFLLATPWED